MCETIFIEYESLRAYEMCQWMQSIGIQILIVNGSYITEQMLADILADVCQELIEDENGDDDDNYYEYE